jgi:crotonobetainyl-CoA:carnitine CoA-transferase CaiB-like acyl-CoA transferase
VAIDRPEGADVVRRLAAGADVFVCNLIHDRQTRFGLDATTLLGVNPRLVHATLSGFGPDGPDCHRPGYDVTVFFGRGAVTDTMTDPGGVAPHPRPAQGDHAAGMSLLASILAALRLVERTGQGQVVDVSLLGMAAWTMATDLAAPLVDGRQPTKRDRHHVISPLANRFPCADSRWIVFNMPEPRWWPRFCEAVGRPEWIDDERFSSTRARFQNMPELIDLIDARMCERPLAEWAQVFDQHGLIWGPAANLAELASDPQAEAAGLFPTVDHPDGSFRTVAAPFRLHHADVGPRGPAPEVGEHTAEVLRELGLDAEEMARLGRGGAVAGPGLPAPPTADSAGRKR